MGFLAILLSIGLAVFIIAVLGTGWLLGYLRRRAILDHPNTRSSHAVAMPRGGGIAVLAAIVLAWLPHIVLTDDQDGGLILGAALALGLLSWFDDLYDVPVLARLAVQLVAVGLGLGALPYGGLVFQGLLPPLADAMLAGLAWVWFVNLFNFMDGIDGIAGTETVAIGLGLTAVLLAADRAPEFAYYALTLAAAALGFLKWNWPPARIFLGDVGSVPLGFLLGWLLLAAAASGLWAAALILPLYYLVDATVTLMSRLVRGEKIWQAHRGHFYQQAARRWGGHGPVVRAIAIANVAFIALALLGSLYPDAAWPGLILAGAIAVLLLWSFAERGEGMSRD